MAKQEQGLSVIEQATTALSTDLGSAAEAAIKVAEAAAEAEMVELLAEQAESMGEDADFGLDFAGAFDSPLPRDSSKAARQGKKVDGLTPTMRRMLWTWNPSIHNWRAVAVANFKGAHVRSTAQGTRQVEYAILYACTAPTCPVVERNHAPHFTCTGVGEVIAYGQRKELQEAGTAYSLPPSEAVNAIPNAPTSTWFVNRKTGQRFPMAKYEGPAY